MESPILLPSNDMSVCTNCGAQMDLHRKYCPWCGTENTQATESAMTTKKLDSSIDDWDDTGWAYDSATVTNEGGSSASLKLPGRFVVPTKPPTGEPAPTPPSIGHTFRLWLRPLSLTLLIVLIAFIAFITLGIYQGINDRQVQNKVAAIDSFNEGRSKMDEGQYDLAIAHFREALRLEPNFEAAAQFLNIAEQNAEIARKNKQNALNTPEPEPTLTPAVDLSANETEVVPTVVESSPTPVEVSVSVFDPDKLWLNAEALLENEEWELAVATLDGLKSQAADYRSEELAEYLASALINLGNRALEEQEVKDALTYFEKAVAAQPDNQEVQELRTLTASYLNGQRAYDKQQWDTATKQLRKVYVLEPEFLETAELLAQAHFELGQQFEERAIWCQAVEQYRSSLLVKQSQDVSKLANESDQKCSSEAIAAVASTQTSNRLTSTATIVTKTSVATKSAFSPTATFVPTRGTPTISPSTTNTATASASTTSTSTVSTPTTSTATTATSIPTVTTVPGSNETATIAAYYETATIAAYYETATIAAYYETATIAAYDATATQDTVNYYATVTAQAFDIYATVTAEAALGTATPVPAVPTVPVSNPPTDTPIPTSNSPTDTPIPVEPTLTIAPTPTLEQLSSPVPEPTAESSSAGYTVASVSQNTDPSSCNGQYIQGTITEVNGAARSGVSIVANDIFGNFFPVTSKTDGTYDIPISDEPNTFTVTIADSPSITIEHNPPQGTPLCHIINWYFNP